MATKNISISIKSSDLIAKIHRNLAIIGKRAKNVKGEPLFTDLTTSTLEDPIFDDLLLFGAQNIVSDLADVAKAYTETTGNQIDFDITFTRWNVIYDEDEEGEEYVLEPDLTEALKGLIFNYLYNFCLARYLSAIHPQLGEKYPPLFGQTYTDACAVIMQNIKTLAFLKRPVTTTSGKSYADVKKVTTPTT